MYKIFYVILIMLAVSCGDSAEVTPVRGRNDRGEFKPRGKQRHRRGEWTAEVPSARHSGDTVFVSHQSVVRTKLKFTTVDRVDYNLQYTTTGVVRPLSGQRAEISSPFEGRIIRSFISLGQKVAKGSPLFEVSSSEYLEYVRDFLQAKNERDLAEKNHSRKQELFDTGVSSRKELDESQLAFNLADKEYKKAEGMLRILNLDPETADLTRPLIIRSPLAGEVVRSEITVGQYLKPDDEPVVTIANIDDVWVVANVKEKDLGSISKDDRVEIYSEGMNNTPVTGIVDYIGNIMNPETRSIEVFIRCNNAGHRLKYGMFVMVRFYHAIPGAIVIPAGAVLQDNVKSYVFVQKDQDVFVKKEVTVTSAPDRKLIVRSGLVKGEVIVSEGGIYLR